MLGDKINFVLNNEEFLHNKDELLYSLKKYMKECKENKIEYSKNRRDEILRLLDRFIKRINHMDLPQIAELGWSYIYAYDTDGLYLRLQHCSEVHVDKAEEFTRYAIDSSFDLFNEQYVFLSVSDYAKLHSVTDTTVRQWIRRGKLRFAVKRGGEWYIPSIEDKPGRGYKGADYKWTRRIVDLELRFPYLAGIQMVSIEKSRQQKGRYSVWSRKGEIACLEAKDREILELALIEHPEVKYDVELSEDILYPDKKRELVIKGGKVMAREDSSFYENDIVDRLQEHIEFSVSSSRRRYDDLDVWEFWADMIRWDITDGEEKEEKVLKLTGGMILPSSVEADESEYFINIVDFCDSISGDHLAVADAIFDSASGGLRQEILKENDTEWMDSCCQPVVYIQDISYKDIKYLELFLQRFNGYAAGFPCAGECQLAVVLLNWEKEHQKLKAYIDAGWKTHKSDRSTVVVYRKL